MEEGEEEGDEFDLLTTSIPFTFESVAFPGCYLTPCTSSSSTSSSSTSNKNNSSNGSNTVLRLMRGAPLLFYEASKPTFSFALSMGLVNFSPDPSIPYQTLSNMSISSPPTSPNSQWGNKRFNMMEALPEDLVRYILSFFSHIDPGEHVIDPSLTQSEWDCLPLATKRDGILSVRCIRGVCKKWREYGNSLICSIRTGSIIDGTTKRDFLQFVYTCPSVTSISFRNLETLNDKELCNALSSNRKFLRVVNVGGCYSISDVSLRVIANLHLVHVNLAMTTITDESLILIANRCPFLLSINLYGAQHITHRGVSILLQSCRKLTSINLRGTSIGVDGLGVLREMAHIHCEVLTGNLLQVLFCNDFYFD